VSQQSTGLSDHERRNASSAGGRTIPCPDDDRVMNVQQWADRVGISYPTAKRLIAAGDGPAITRLSPNRLGITFGAHRAWVKNRTKQAGQ
jgi:predicted DNA-binding transcriptional regulator AlpA